VVLELVFLYWVRPYLNRLHELCFACSFVLVCWYAYRLLPWGAVDHVLLDWLFQTLCILLSAAYLVLPRDYFVLAQLVLLAYPIRDDTISIIVLGFTSTWIMVLVIETTMGRKVDVTQLAMATGPLLRTHMPLFMFYFGCLVIFKTVTLYGYGVQYQPLPKEEDKKEAELEEEEEHEPLASEEAPPEEPPPTPPPPSVRKPKILPLRVQPGPVDIVITQPRKVVTTPKPQPQVAPVSVLAAAVNEQLNGMSFSQIFKKEKNDRNSS
jgi:hypothetical protein